MRIEFKTKKSQLTNLEVKCWYEDAPGLFARLRMTPEGEQYLREHQKLAEVIEKL